VSSFHQPFSPSLSPPKTPSLQVIHLAAFQAGKVNAAVYIGAGEDLCLAAHAGQQQALLFSVMSCMLLCSPIRSYLILQIQPCATLSQQALLRGPQSFYIKPWWSLKAGTIVKKSKSKLATTQSFDLVRK